MRDLWVETSAFIYGGPMRQLDMLKGDLKTARFDGATYDHSKDYYRLTGQLNALYGLLKDSQWRTLSQIEQDTGIPQASASAQLRNLRKAKFGGFTVNRKRVGNVYFYQVIV